MKREIQFVLICILLISLSFTNVLASAFAGNDNAVQNYINQNNEYQDDTIHIKIKDIEQDDSIYHVAYINITNPSQLCTALSSAPGTKVKEYPSVIAKENNALIAINGDSYLYRSTGYIVRQGQVLRKSPSMSLDMLIIDTSANFHVIRKPTKDKIVEALNSYEVEQCFAFGPVLVMDNEVQTVYNKYDFAPQDKSPRTAIGQLGPLSYVMVVVDGRQEQSRGVTHKQLAEFMGSIGCTVAYNLDGGGSSTLFFNGEIYNSLSGAEERETSDIIYFKSDVAND